MGLGAWIAIAFLLGGGLIAVGLVTAALVLGRQFGPGIDRFADKVQASFLSLGISIVCGFVASVVQPVAAVFLGGTYVICACCWTIAKSPVSGLRWLWSRGHQEHN
jgi:hypothetical protein